MFLHTRLLLCMSVSVLFSPAKSQLKYWHQADKKLDFSGAVPTMTTFTSNTAAQTANGVYDPNGALLFYVADNNIYDAANALVGTMNSVDDYTHNETIIVPVPGSDICTRKFLVVKSYHAGCCGGEVDISYVMVTCTTNTSNNNVVTAASEVLVNNGIPANWFYSTHVAIAAWIPSGMLSGTSRVFVIGGGGTNGWVDRYDVTSNGLSNRTTIYTSTSAPGSPSEADLSPDGMKLAWAEFDGFTSNRFHVIGLDGNQDYVPSSEAHFNAGTQQSTYSGRGLEFNGASTKLYFSALNSVYVADLTSFPTLGTITAISGSSAYANSQLERAWNGRIYVASSTDLRAIDETLNTMDATSFVNYVSTVQNNLCCFRTLPDQLDGLDYTNNFTSLGVIYNFNTYVAPTGVQTWIDGSNPMGGLSSPVRIRNTLTIPTGANVTIQNMTFEFGVNATLIVQNGATLKIDVSTLQAVPCALMWQGIQVQNGGTVIMTNTSNTLSNSNLYDAIIGMDVIGTSSTLTVNGNSRFEKNEMHVKLNNVTPAQVSLIKSNFNHLIALKDQNKGVLDLGSKKGITSISVINCTGSAVVIGDATFNVLNNNTFRRGQYGVHMFGSNVNVFQNTFQNTQTSSVYGDANNIARTTTLTKNTFTTVKNAVTLERKYNATLTTNTFTSGSQHGVIWRNNANCYFHAGDITNTNSALGNTFNNNNWTSFYLYDNAGVTTNINLCRNVFNGPSYATGISVSENALTPGVTYYSFDIINNTFTGIETGMNILNIRGYALTPNVNVPVNTTSAIRNNTVGISNAVNPAATGILVNNSPGLSILENSVTSNNSYDWQNNGIKIENSPNTLVYKNTLQAGIGLRAGLNMLNSDYFCNYLVNNVVGIQLGYHALRINSATIHGSSTFARPNTFTGTAGWGWAIELYCSDPALNKWYFAASTPTINYATPGSCAPLGTIVAGTLGTDPCGGAKNMMAGTDSSLHSFTKVYPNPGTGIFTVETAAGSFIKSLQVKDLTGRVIKDKQEINLESFQFDISDEENGIYLLTIWINNETLPLVYKVVLNR